MKSKFLRIAASLTLRGSRGDTIVEVMVTTTVLALVLATSFVTASHSLRAGTNAANRNQALQLAEQQVELLRVAISTGELTTGQPNKIPAGEFCMSSATHKTASAGTCDQTPFVVKVRYDYDYDTNTVTANKTFSVAVQWSSSSSASPNQVVLYYQDPQDE